MIKFLFLILLGIYPAEEPEWSLKKDEEGIKIYTRSVEGSSFEEFRGIILIENSNLSEVLSVILDVKNYESLFPNVINPKVLKVVGMYLDIYYFQITAPWPIEKRDAIYEQKTNIDENGTHAIVSLKPLPDYISENSGMVRIYRGSGFWELKEDGKNNVKVIYQFQSEPGGDIPAWLTNRFVVDHPFKTLNNLKGRLRNN